MSKTLQLATVACIALMLICAPGCGGKKQPEMLANTTVEGLAPVPGTVAGKVTCVTESYPTTCLDASTGSEHCKYMLRRNAERQLLEGLETLSTTTESYERESEAVDNAIKVIDRYSQETGLHVQFSYHESNMFRQKGEAGDNFLMRVCVINDEAANHMLRSLKEKASAEKRTEIADYCGMLLDAWYDGEPPDRDAVEETTTQLYEHYTDLYVTAQGRMSKKKK